MLHLAPGLLHGLLQGNQQCVPFLVPHGRIPAPAAGDERLVSAGLQHVRGTVHRQRRRVIHRSRQHFPVAVLRACLSQDRSEVRFLSGIPGAQCGPDRLRHGHGASHGRPGDLRRRRAWRRHSGQHLQGHRRSCFRRGRSCGCSRRCRRRIPWQLCQQVQGQLLCP